VIFAVGDFDSYSARVEANDDWRAGFAGRAEAIERDFSAAAGEAAEMEIYA
jgi:hypothetical protein